MRTIFLLLPLLWTVIVTAQTNELLAHWDFFTIDTNATGLSVSYPSGEWLFSGTIGNNEQLLPRIRCCEWIAVELWAHFRFNQRIQEDSLLF
jgi:hypothetical protein